MPARWKQERGKAIRGWSIRFRNRSMKIPTLSLAILILGSWNVSAHNNQSYTGEIMDGPCAWEASHDAMISSHPTLETTQDCALLCVKAGSQYVIYDSSTGTIYQIDGQKKVVRFAAQRVTITGNLEADKTIRARKYQGSSHCLTKAPLNAIATAGAAKAKLNCGGNERHRRSHRCKRNLFADA